MRPHPMHIGQALRVLGWTTRRDWTRDGVGRKVWIVSLQLIEKWGVNEIFQSCSLFDCRI
jgi:hypothetical protein